MSLPLALALLPLGIVLACLAFVDLRRPVLWRRLAGSMPPAWRKRVGLERLARRPKVLNAWLAAHAEALTPPAPLADAPIIELPLTLRLDGRPMSGSDDDALARALDAAPGRLLLAAAPGCGGTRLADRLIEVEADRRAVLRLQGPFGLAELGDRDALHRRIARELARRLRFAAEVDTGLVADLLAAGRLAVAFDGIEPEVLAGPALRRATRAGAGHLTLLTWGPPPSAPVDAPVLTPEPIAPDEVEAAVATLLAGSKARVRFGRHDAARLAAALDGVADRDGALPVGLVVTLVQSAVGARLGGRQTQLPQPASRTGLLLQAAAVACAGQGDGLPLERDAASLAAASLGPGLRPEVRPVHDVLAALRGGDVRDRLRALERAGLLRLVHTGAGDLQVGFRSDGIARALAARHEVARAAGRGSAWLEIVARLQAPAVDPASLCAMARALAEAARLPGSVAPPPDVLAALDAFARGQRPEFDPPVLSPQPTDTPALALVG